MAQPKSLVARSILGLVAWLALVGLAAGIAGIASVDAPRFYASLDLPRWAPPPWVFGPVWTLLYIAMAVSAWLVWKENGWRGARAALALFCVQLVLNALWSWLFFAWHRGAAAFADIAVLWVLLLVLVATFQRSTRLAAILLVPYLAWVTYAAALNFAVWQRNPSLLG